MLCLKVLVIVSALCGALAQQQQQAGFGGFAGPLQGGRPLDAFSQPQPQPQPPFGQQQQSQPQALPGGRSLDAFGRSAGVPAGTLPLAAAPAPPPRRSPALGPRPDASGRLAEDLFGPPEPYQFQYSVSDAESGAAFRQQENSDGRGVEGQYVVQLPDGRNQIVKYSATAEDGFHADVIYEGEPVYPPAPAPRPSGGGGGGGGGGGRVGGGQQPRSLPPRPAPSPTPLPSGPPPANAFAPGLGRPDGNLVAPRLGAPPGQVAFGGGGQQFDSTPRGLGAGGFDGAGSAGGPGAGFGNSLEAPQFGPTGGDLSIPGGPAFGSFGAPAPTVAVGGRRVNIRG